MRKNRRLIQGIVIADKMTKTIRVEVSRTQLHPVFGKYLRRKKSFMAHDEKSECHMGDRVEILESRPMSKQKRWTVVRILEKAAAPVADTTSETSPAAPSSGGAA